MVHRLALVASLALLSLPGCAVPGSGSDDLTSASRSATAAPSHIETAGLQAWDHLLSLRDDGGRWSEGLVPYLVEAAVAGGRDPRSWPPELPLVQQLGWPADNGSYIGSLRSLYAFALANERAEEVEGRILEGFDGRQFGDPALLNDDAFALLALHATADRDDPRWSGWTASLASNQSDDGGWSWGVGGPGETDMTGIVLDAIGQEAQAGPADSERAAVFFATTRAPDGGHALMPGDDAGNCDSTVWALRGLARVEGGDGASDAERRAAWDFLLALQRDDGGFAYQPDGPANALCTAEVAALIGDAVHGRVPGPVGATAAT